MSNPDPVIVALDKPDLSSAVQLAKKLDPKLCRVKVGKELFTATGPAVIDAMHDMGFQIFLDLKFHDIPNTVAGACRAAANRGVWMLNVHASGGSAMLDAARDALGSPGGGTPLLIGVTVLTSMDDNSLAATGVQSNVQGQVERLTGLVSAAGLDGVVCSALEAAAVKSSYPQLLTVTPGIRLAEDASDDQKRIVTPDQAVKGGADYLVIGRPITAAAEPVEKLATIRQLLS
ncbi:MAG: orotidine-5'-phosphate decarboxylase [Pseudomonadota bacterium]